MSFTMDNKLPLKWSIISDIHTLTLISDDWDSLNNAAPHSTIFNSPLWLFTWIEQYWQSEWQLYVIIARNNEKLVALAPFYIQPALHLGGINKLYPLGQGEPECSEVFSEYNDILILPEFEDSALAELAQLVQEIDIDQIIWRAALIDSHINALLFNIYNHSTQASGARYLIKGSDWATDNLSKNVRSRYRRGLNQLAKVEAKIDWVKKEDFEHYWLLMKEFHQRRWQNQDKTGAFASHEFNLFHREFRQQAPDNIAMSAIWVNDSPIAIHYYFVDSSTLYFYQSGWNEDEYSHLSPGLILHLWGIEHNTKPFYDFMMGKNQDSYKAKFSPLQQPMYNFAINFSPIKVMLHRILKKIKLISH